MWKEHDHVDDINEVNHPDKIQFYDGSFYIG